MLSNSANQLSKADLKYKCTICNANFSRQKYLDVHTKECHISLLENEEKTPLKPNISNHYICTYCNIRFTQSSTLQIHVAMVHEGKNLYKCSICDNYFKSRRLCQIHMATFHGNKPYSCDKCDASFSLKAKLKEHLLVKEM